MKKKKQDLPDLPELPKTIKLSGEEVRLANYLGVSLKDYAREKAETYRSFLLGHFAGR